MLREQHSVSSIPLWVPSSDHLLKVPTVVSKRLSAARATVSIHWMTLTRAGAAVGCTVPSFLLADISHPEERTALVGWRPRIVARQTAINAPASAPNPPSLSAATSWTWQGGRRRETLRWRLGRRGSRRWWRWVCSRRHRRRHHRRSRVAAVVVGDTFSFNLGTCRHFSAGGGRLGI